MATATLNALVKMVRAEAGHALNVAQGINTVETLKHLIRRTEYELWTSFSWPHLMIRSQVTAAIGQYRYNYPAELSFDQIREFYWAAAGSNHFSVLEYGIPEDCIAIDGTNSTSGPTVKVWEDGQDDTQFRVWPTPNAAGTFRLKGMRVLNNMVDDTDFCTLDPTLITLFVSAELLSRAKAEDAQNKMQKAQRHLQKTLALKTSDKTKVSTMGASRSHYRGLYQGQRFTV